MKFSYRFIVMLLICGIVFGWVVSCCSSKPKYFLDSENDMNKSSNETSSKKTLSVAFSENKADPLVAAKQKVKPKPVVPTDATLKLECRYVQETPSWDQLNLLQWSQVSPAVFDRNPTTAVSDGPKTSVRFLWSETHLMFCVTVDQDETTILQNDNDKLWMGSNIEFLISPRWIDKPFYDEYEFLFNASGGYNDLYWYDGASLDLAFDWNAAHLQWKRVEKSSLGDNSPGWAFVGMVPFDTFDIGAPKPGEYWGLGLFRKDVRQDSTSSLYAWSPPLNNPPKFHEPSRFGMLVFMP
jgi:hypothetical protein